MTILLTVILTILCICNIVELAILFPYFSNRKNATATLRFPTENDIPNAEPAPLYSEEEMKELRKRTQAELEAFQELMSYNADKAYGIDRSREE